MTATNANIETHSSTFQTRAPMEKSDKQAWFRDYLITDAEKRLRTR